MLKHFIYPVAVELFYHYSVRRATTGSFFAALLDGMIPANNVRSTLITTNTMAPSTGSIALRFSIAFYGACPDSYELDIDNLHDLDVLNQYDVLNVTENENKTTVYLSNQYNEMELLNNLAIDLEGKCDWYSLSWNIYSYL